ncbi:MAG: VCBS repeat-containing protein, partial [Gammaproteobacteria bacterium]
VDILWRNGSTGQNAVWFMNGATIVSSTSIQSVTDLNWKIVSVGDYNGDGKADILWRNGSTGQNAIFFMNGGTVASTLYPPSQPVAGWTVALH